MLRSSFLGLLLLLLTVLVTACVEDNSGNTSDGDSDGSTLDGDLEADQDQDDDGWLEINNPSCPMDADCAGRSCGNDPVCGIICGQCSDGYDCIDGNCVKQQPECPQETDCENTECGPDPVCGTICGTCETGYDCLEGSCVEQTPECPQDADCSELECGADPVCGIICGSCESGYDCNQGVCVEQSPTCPDDADCSELDCGPDPICGVECGMCDAQSRCVEGRCISVVTEGFTFIQAGTFTMGSPLAEGGRDDDETQWEATLTYNYEIMTYETTQGQFAELMEYNPSYFKSCGDTCPVEQVSWYEALKFANKFSEAHDLATCFDCTGEGELTECSLKPIFSIPQHCPGFRLPTEAEWEYAARAGSETAFYEVEGSDGSISEVSSECRISDPNCDLIAWHCGNSGETMHPVGQKLPNAWGLYDVLGNAWEWNWDLYGDYPSEPQTDYSGLDSGVLRSRRGGSCLNAPRSSRLADRYIELPNARWKSIGFRLVRTIREVED